MRRWKLILAAGIMIFACVGCGAQKEENAASTEDVAVVEEQMESEQIESETEEKNGNYDDLEEKGDSGEAAAFAKKIQDAVSAKDMEAVADLCAYPLAVNGEVVENRDAFMELGADTVLQRKDARSSRQ